MKNIFINKHFSFALLEIKWDTLCIYDSLKEDKINFVLF